MALTADAITPFATPNSADSSFAQTLEQQLPMLRQRLMRQARVTVYDTALAEDLVQETLPAVFEQEPSRRGQASLSTWATAILKNKVADWYRSPNRTRFAQPAENPADGDLSEDIDALYDATGHYVQQVPSWQQPDSHMEQRQVFTILEQCGSRHEECMQLNWLDHKVSV